MVIEVDADMRRVISLVTTSVDTTSFFMEVVTLSKENLGRGLYKDPDKSTHPPNEMGVEVW